MIFSVKEITLKNGSMTHSYVQFNNDYSHILVDDGCWIVANGQDGEIKFSSWLFPEALEALKQLPNHPYDYEPYKKLFQMV